MKEKILQSIEESVSAVQQLAEPHNLLFIAEVSQCIADTFTNKNKLIVAGNGGSLCDAVHCAEEFTGFFRSLRPALPAIALADPGHLTCVGNDIGFDKIFSRGIEAYGQPGDLFLGLSTSGNSRNIICAFEEAKDRGMKTVAFLGKNGGKLRGVADYELIIRGFSTSDRIQEAHMAAIHIIIEQVEHLLFAPQEEGVALTAGGTWGIG